MAKDTIDQIARRLADSLPQGIRNMRDDLEHNFRGILQSGLTRLDLVTREEFEVQQSVLARTREKLEALEARLGALQAAAVNETSAGPAANKPKAKKTAASKKAATKQSTKKKSTKKESTNKESTMKKSTRKKTAKKQPAKKKAAKTTKKSGR